MRFSTGDGCVYFFVSFPTVSLQPCSDIWDCHSSILSSSHNYDCLIYPHLPGLQKQGLQTKTREERQEGNKVRTPSEFSMSSIPICMYGCMYGMYVCMNVCM